MPCGPVSAVHGFKVPEYTYERERVYKGLHGLTSQVADVNPWTKHGPLIGAEYPCIAAEYLLSIDL
jgi:hypothetical protein